MSKGNVIQKSADVMGGTPVFPGTRVPIRTLLDYIEGGDNLDQFLDDFPSVKREQIALVLAYLKDHLGDLVA